MGDFDLFFKVTEVKNFVIYSTLIISLLEYHGALLDRNSIKYIF